MKNINPEQSKRSLHEQAEKVDDNDIKKVLNEQEKIEDKFKKNDSLSGYFEKAKTMFSLLKDYWNGNYREIPWKIIAAIAGALLYVLIPLDFIPDFIPIGGFLDDAGVIAACLSLVNDDLIAYEKWKILQDSPSPEKNGNA